MDGTYSTRKDPQEKWLAAVDNASTGGRCPQYATTLSLLEQSSVPEFNPDAIPN